ncbi:MAG: MXAN_5187 C-terminal domain-containing protein [Acidobacteriota bacterium]|nr:MXAN_5187 C-terminal domain-containing protein [Acidobacteriota bacterium]
MALARLDDSIRRLKTQYDMFFNGALPREPIELRTDVERMIKRYANAPLRKYAHRYHLNALVGRFNSFSELWGKTLRSLEEGARATPQSRATAHEKVLGRCRLHDPLHEQERLRELHARYLEARSKYAGKNGNLPFETFVRGVATQAERVRAKSGCDEIELRLVLSERKVHLRARPGR